MAKIERICDKLKTKSAENMHLEVERVYNR